MLNLGGNPRLQIPVGHGSVDQQTAPACRDPESAMAAPHDDDKSLHGMGLVKGRRLASAVADIRAQLYRQWGRTKGTEILNIPSTCVRILGRHEIAQRIPWLQMPVTFTDN